MHWLRCVLLVVFHAVKLSSASLLSNVWSSFSFCILWCRTAVLCVPCFAVPEMHLCSLCDIHSFQSIHFVSVCPHHLYISAVIDFALTSVCRSVLCSIYLVHQLICCLLWCFSMCVVCGVAPVIVLVLLCCNWMVYYSVHCVYTPFLSVLICYSLRSSTTCFSVAVLSASVFTPAQYSTGPRAALVYVQLWW